MIAELDGHKFNMFCKENYLFSPRALVRGIPDRAQFAPENISMQVNGRIYARDVML